MRGILAQLEERQKQKETESAAQPETAKHKSLQSNILTCFSALGQGTQVEGGAGQPGHLRGKTVGVGNTATDGGVLLHTAPSARTKAKQQSQLWVGQTASTTTTTAVVTGTAVRGLKTGQTSYKKRLAGNEYSGTKSIDSYFVKK